jgi:hypothetical protein
VGCCRVDTFLVRALFPAQLLQIGTPAIADFPRFRRLSTRALSWSSSPSGQNSLRGWARSHGFTTHNYDASLRPDVTEGGRIDLPRRVRHAAVWGPMLIERAPRSSRDLAGPTPMNRGCRNPGICRIRFYGHLTRKGPVRSYVRAQTLTMSDATRTWRTCAAVEMP